MQIKTTIFTLLLLSIAACSNPQPGPDKTVAGAALGAAWGAGAGAVIGNQVSYAGEGAAVGAGFGLIGGAMSGIGYDLTEDALIEQEKMLASLKIQNAANARELELLQAKFDYASFTDIQGGVQQVYFDVDASNLRSGSVAILEVLADQLKTNPHAYTINVIGHSDDSGNLEYNQRLAEARARTVSSYLAARGISLDRIAVKSFGSERPMASNSTATGRQFNRRVDVYISR